MRRIIRATITVLAFTGGTTALSAAPDGSLRLADHNGAMELASGDLATAERILVAARQVSPNDADLLLNQAQLYVRSGRADAARTLYARVLAQPDEAMLLSSDRWEGSHDLARAGMQAANTTRIAGR